MHHFMYHSRSLNYTTSDMVQITESFEDDAYIYCEDEFVFVSLRMDKHDQYYKMSER